METIRPFVTILPNGKILTEMVLETTEIGLLAMELSGSTMIVTDMVIIQMEQTVTNS